MADVDLPLFAAPGNEDVPAIPPAVADQGLFAAPGNNQPAGPRTDDDTSPSPPKFT